jgi:phytoene dehydrogenase-like protein
MNMKIATPDRFREYINTRYDAIVIGAGIGGLTTAAVLAKHGRSVLVLEMHYELGGCATVFSRNGKGQGYEFDVGLHYVGDCAPGGLIPRILEGAGVTDIRFLEQDPQGFDTMYFPDFQFRMPRGAEQFRERLVQTFPSEVRGIDRYIKLLYQVWELMGVHANPLSAFRVVPRSLLALRYMNATVGEFVDTCTRDPRLKAVLTGQLGVYHQPPSRASLMGHAGVTMHFLHGSFYPAGGGQVLSDRLAEVVEGRGNKILLRTTATRILTENGRAVGVEFQNKALGKQVAHAPVVISNADIKHTMLHLLGDDQLSRAASHKVRNYEMSPAMGVVYLGVKRDFRAEGMPNTNLRIYPGYDFEEAYNDCFAERFSARPHVFVGNASLKDPMNPKVAPPGVSNLQLMSLAPSSFAAWKITESEYLSGDYRRNAAYYELKERFADALIRETERVIPGLSKDIVFKEVATPITLMRYTGASNGTSYGVSMIPSQFLHNRPGAKTGIKGLLLSGASLRTGHGIFGAMTSGVEAAAMVVGHHIKKDIFYARKREASSYTLALCRCQHCVA